jgi:protein TonB
VESRDLRPTILYKERAKYTEDARQNQIQGTVVLSVIFGADGRIHDVRALRSLPHGLTEEAISVVQRIRFNPAVRGGKPVSVRSTIEYNFTLY